MTMREVLTPRNRLAETAVKGAGPSLETILERVSAGIDDLKQEYESELQVELKRLGDAAAEMAGADDAEQAAALQEIYDLAHEIRGLAGSFGYPLLTKVANALCGFIERKAARPAKTVEVVECHVGALRAVAAGGVTGDGGQQGLELLASLAALIDKADSEAPEPAAGA